MTTDILPIFEKTALLAGQAILDIYRASPEVRRKQDHSPVTEADECAEAIILNELAAALPHIPVVAEEAVAAGHVPDIAGGRFILVDPLDGTKEFIGGQRDFTVNIALIENGSPTFGIVYAPALGIAYVGGGGLAEKLTIGSGFTVADRVPVKCRMTRSGPICVTSRSHSSAETQDYIRRSGICDIRTVGSSLKFCLLADGSADFYPRFGRTMEWDTAAGDAILRAAGGCTYTVDGQPLIYGKTGRAEESDFENPNFIALSGPWPQGMCP